MFKFIHAADIHLDSPLRGLSSYDGCPAEQMRSASRRAFEALIDLAIEEKVDFVVLAGDVYDGDWKDYNTGLFFASQLTRLKSASIPVYLVSGNHDAGSRMTKTLSLPDNVHRFKTSKAQTFALDDIKVALHGQGYATQAVKENLAVNYPDAISGYYNIGVLHTAADGREGHAAYAPCSISDMTSKGYNYWALGHVHDREVLSEDPWIVFSGNIQGRTIRETGAKGCELVTVADDDTTSIEQKTLDVARWEHLNLQAQLDSDPSDIMTMLTDSIAEHMAAADGRMLAVRVTIEGQCAAHSAFRSEAEQWTNEIRAAATEASGGDVWVEKVRFKTSTPLDLDRLAESDGPVGHLLSYVRDLSSNEEALQKLAMELDSLKEKLPVVMKTGEDSLDLSDPEWIKELVESTRADFAQRLLVEEDRS